MMRTTPDPRYAHVFPSHRALVERIVVLKADGEIDGYSIHAVPDGFAAGVRKGDAWVYLAKES